MSLLLPTWTTNEYFIFWTRQQTELMVNLNWFDSFFLFFLGNLSFSVLLFLQSILVHPLGIMWWFCFSNYGLFLPIPPLFLFLFFLCTLFLLESPPPPFTLQTHPTKTKFLSPRCAQCTQARCWSWAALCRQRGPSPGPKMAALWAPTTARW